MRTARQIRFETSDHGTFSSFFMPSIGFQSFIAEPPWKNNRTNVSCIPAGTYIVEPVQSPKYGLVFCVTDVSGRKYILHHSGNWAGDIEKGMRSHTHGCQLHGQKIGYLGGQRAVLNSRITVNEFMRKTNMEPFKLIISWLY